MIDRYSRKELKDIWSDYNKYSIWLKIELASAQLWRNIRSFQEECQKKLN